MMLVACLMRHPGSLPLLGGHRMQYPQLERHMQIMIALRFGLLVLQAFPRLF